MIPMSVRMFTVLALVAIARPPHAADALARFAVDDGAIARPLDGARGDPARGRALILARDPANCLLCHAIPDPEARFAGDLGPPLDGIAGRLTAGRIRLVIVDNTWRDPRTAMPSYYRIEGLSRVAAAWRGKPILDAQQIEDIVAYLATLR